MPIHMPAVTLLLAAALGLLNLWLGLRVSQLRIVRKVMVGDGGDAQIQARMRALSNFVEYVPIALILTGLIEMRTGESTWLWLLGSALVVGRVLHPFGMERPAPNLFRMLGILLTWVVLAALVGWAVLLGFSPAETMTTLG